MSKPPKKKTFPKVTLQYVGYSVRFLSILSDEDESVIKVYSSKYPVTQNNWKVSTWKYDTNFYTSSIDVVGHTVLAGFMNGRVDVLTFRDGDKTYNTPMGESQYKIPKHEDEIGTLRIISVGKNGEITFVMPDYNNKSILVMRIIPGKPEPRKIFTYPFPDIPSDILVIDDRVIVAVDRKLFLLKYSHEKITQVKVVNTLREGTLFVLTKISNNRFALTGGMSIDIVIYDLDLNVITEFGTPNSKKISYLSEITPNRFLVTRNLDMTLYTPKPLVIVTEDNIITSPGLFPKREGMRNIHSIQFGQTLGLGKDFIAVYSGSDMKIMNIRAQYQIQSFPYEEGMEGIFLGLLPHLEFERDELTRIFSDHLDISRDLGKILMEYISS